MDLQTIYILAGFTAAVLTIIGKITGFFKWMMNLYRRTDQTSSTNIQIPKQTVALVPVPNYLLWSMGKIGDKSGMQIVGDLNVTNISNHDVYLKVAKLRKPKAVTSFMTVRAQKSNIHGDYVIPRGAVSDLRFVFFIQPPVCEEGKPFKGDVAIIDNFGNEHWLKGLEFRSTKEES